VLVFFVLRKRLHNLGTELAVPGWSNYHDNVGFAFKNWLSP